MIYRYNDKRKKLYMNGRAVKIMSPAVTWRELKRLTWADVKTKTWGELKAGRIEQ